MANNALPKQVRDQIARANKIGEELAKRAKPEEEEEKPKLEVVPDTEEVEADAGNDAPEPKSEEKTVEQEKTEEPKAQTSAADFEHKYKVLQGKYDKEVPRLNRQLRETQGEISKLHQMLAELKDTKPNKLEQPEPEHYITPEEMEEYGDEFMDVVGRKAKEVTAPLVKDLRAEIAKYENMVKSLDTNFGVTRQEQVHAQLDKAVENWREINEDAGFLGWLDETDEFSGRSRGALLSEAYEGKDGPRVVAFFQKYLSENADQNVNTNDADLTPENPKVDMKSLVAPGKPKGSAMSSAQKDKEVWTRAEIAKFYSDVNKGKFKNDPKTKAKIEARIGAALASGRVRIDT